MTLSSILGLLAIGIICCVLYIRIFDVMVIYPHLDVEYTDKEDYKSFGWNRVTFK